MIMTTPKNLLVRSLLLVMVLMAVSWTKAETSTSSPSSFQCGNLEGALEIPSLTTTTATTMTSSFLFDTIETDLKIDNWKDRNTQLLPGTIHWHIYAIDNDQTPKYSCYPEGLVEPQISGSTLHLAPIKNRLNELGYHQGDKIQSSINLYIPLQQLRNIQLNGVGEVVEVIVTEKLLSNVTTSMLPLPSIRIRVSGVNSILHVNASNSPIYFSASGVDTDATIAAGRNSTIELSGVDQRVRIKSEHVNGKIRLSGITTRLILEGDYDSIDMSGVDCKVLVNGPTGCNSVHNSGVNNECRIPSSSDANNNTIIVPELDCLSTTTVVEGTCGISVGAIVGIIIGSLLVIGLCIFGCIYKCRRGGRGHYPYQGQQEPPKDFSSSLQVPEGAPTTTLSPPVTGYDPQNNVEHVVEAEVIEIEPVSTTVTTATTIDPEMAKGSDTKDCP